MSQQLGNTVQIEAHVIDSNAIIFRLIYMQLYHQFVLIGVSSNSVVSSNLGLQKQFLTKYQPMSRLTKGLI